jgi:hypothetical protein
MPSPYSDPDNPLTQGAPTWADVPGASTVMSGVSKGTGWVDDWIARQQQQALQQGYWTGGSVFQGGRPTGAGLVNAARQYGNALLMGTTAPGRPAAPAYQLETHSPEALGLPGNLTGAESDAIKAYSSNSRYVNSSPDAEPLRQQLDQAISKSALASDTKLYRGFGLDKDQFEKNYKVGNLIDASDGYVSTSISKDKAQNFADDVYPGEVSVMLHMRHPAGSPALHVPIEGMEAAEFGNQDEVLLPRGSKFRIESMKERADDTYDVTVSPHQDSD